MLSNDQIEAEVTKIAANLAKGEDKLPNETTEAFYKRQEAYKLEIATSALTLLTNFLQNINDLAYAANQTHNT